MSSSHAPASRDALGDSKRNGPAFLAKRNEPNTLYLLPARVGQYRSKSAAICRRGRQNQQGRYRLGAELGHAAERVRLRKREEITDS
jgi:hypothetical protein